MLAAAAKLPAGPVRDLFEGYLPSDEKGERKLGSNPRPRAILALKGDAGRGEKLFWSQAVNCGNCHKSASAARRSGRTCRPSASCVRARTCWRASWSRRAGSSRSTPPISPRPTDGRSLTGLLVKRDEKAVVLRDGQNKEIVLAAEERGGAAARRGRR